MKFIAASESPEKIEALSKDVSFERVSAETVHLINECTGSDLVVPEGEEVINMCKGLEGYGQKERAEGHAEGVLETFLQLLRQRAVGREAASSPVAFTSGLGRSPSSCGATAGGPAQGPLRHVVMDVHMQSEVHRQGAVASPCRCGHCLAAFRRSVPRMRRQTRHRARRAALDVGRVPRARHGACPCRERA